MSMCSEPMKNIGDIKYYLVHILELVVQMFPFSSVLYKMYV